MKNKKITVKLLNHVLVAGMFLTLIPGPLVAFGKTVAKEEVIYGMLDYNGQANEVYVVNIFNESGNITDYGNYQSVRNMTSDTEINMDQNKVTVNNLDDTLYYEGVLMENELPWNISFQYFMNGKEYQAGEIIGKSGDLKLAIKIEENEAVDSFFYENYGVQVTVVLDTEKAQNIQAEDATIANVGKNKQLTYTVLPGKGAEIEIQADVEDFEMEAISINGINLNLGIEIDDAALMEKIEELLSGVDQLDQGAADLKKGAFTLKAGSSKLNDGAYELQTGTVGLDQGAHALKNGVSEIDQALARLNNESGQLTQGSAAFKAALTEIQNRLSEVAIEADEINQLTEASSQIKNGINELNESLALLNQSVGYDQYTGKVKEQGLDLDELKEGNEQAIALLTSIIENLTDVSEKLKAKPEIPGFEYLGVEIEQQIDNLSNLTSLFQGNNAAMSSTEVYLDEVSYAINEVYQGSADLNVAYAEFDGAIVELVNSLNQMIQKLPELTQAIHTLVEKYNEFDTGINNYTEGVAQIVVGYQQIMNGAESLNVGSSSLKVGSSLLYSNLSDLAQGTTDLYAGTETLTEGTNEFVERTANLDEEVQREIDETLLEITGDGSEAISFVSEENKSVESVQFVMKTNALILDEEAEESIVEKSEKLTFWDKLKGLFSFKA